VDISIMARALLLTKPQHFMERAKASSGLREIEAKERPKAQRRTGHLICDYFGRRRRGFPMTGVSTMQPPPFIAPPRHDRQALDKRLHKKDEPGERWDRRARPARRT